MEQRWINQRLSLFLMAVAIQRARYLIYQHEQPKDFWLLTVPTWAPVSAHQAGLIRNTFEDVIHFVKLNKAFQGSQHKFSHALFGCPGKQITIYSRCPLTCLQAVPLLHELPTTWCVCPNWPACHGFGLTGI